MNTGPQSPLKAAFAFNPSISESTPINKRVKGSVSFLLLVVIVLVYLISLKETELKTTSKIGMIDNNEDIEGYVSQ